MTLAMQPALFDGAALRPGNWPFGALQPMRYGVIMVDPPWAFENWSQKGEDHNANQHYATMSIEDIKALPVGSLAAADCALFLWCTGPFTNRFAEIIRAWGFTFSGKGLCWMKPNKSACEGPVEDICDDRNWFMGQGYGARSNSEDCWLGTVGSPTRLDAGVRETIVAPLRAHSRKPDEAYTKAERLYPGPRLDLFSRETRPGWDTWGNEKGKFDQQKGDHACR